ncbi:MAG TPA: hypothetical protein VGC85_00415 [Chthoniobacterales bacterium]
MRSPVLVAISTGLFVVGVLLLIEVIRPFRDLAVDGPIALGCWFVGAVVAAISIRQRRTHIAIGIVALVLNLLALSAAGVLLFLLSHSKWMF